MKLKSSQTNHRKRTLIYALILLLTFAAAGYYFRTTSHTQPSPTQPTNVPPSTTATTPNDSGTNTPDKSTPGATTYTPSTSVQVVIVDASQYGATVEVRAYASALENGQCEITFTHGQTSLKKQVTATPGPSTTSCATLSVPRSEFAAAGTWEIVVQYRSSSGAFSGSTKQSITIT